jgi:AcrR family transcriptional regulator
VPSGNDGKPAGRGARNRERIVRAGAELLHGFPVWHWSALTVSAVAERAGVTERTVYRHFTSERGLRDAVMEYLIQDAKVVMENLQFEDVPDLAQRILEYTATYPMVPRIPQDPTVNATNARTRRKLVEVVEPHTGDWSPVERRIAAAIIDVLWAGVSLERLVGEWELTPAEAIRGTTWAIRLVQSAILANQPPA